jgi:hypothetical protein
MIRSLLCPLLLFALLVLARPVFALTIDAGNIDVGEADQKISQTTHLSGEEAELNWVRSVLGEDITFVIKHDSLTANDWEETSEAGTWAFYLSDSPDYFLVKTGNNGTNDLTSFLFVNNDFKNWAVLDLDDIYVASVTNIGKVSHLSDFNAVPEPGTIFLVGGGLLGFGFSRRKRRKA